MKMNEGIQSGEIYSGIIEDSFLYNISRPAEAISAISIKIRTG
jgi:hypothetical protein